MNDPAPTVAVEESTAPFSLWQRFLLWLMTWAGFLFLRLVGPTLRYTVSIEEGGPPRFFIAQAIYCLWHRCLIPACYWYRDQGAVVMTSRSFDGEYIARILEKLGYGTVRGSSSRSAARALLGMHTEVERGKTATFTIDGPRGPRYVAKPGPVLLARNTSVPIVCFYCALEKPWTLRSWDEFMVPRPFSRAFLRIGKLIHVPEDADAAALERYHAEMQATLDRVREFAEANVTGVPPAS